MGYCVSEKKKNKQIKWAFHQHAQGQTYLASGKLNESYSVIVSFSDNLQNKFY